MSLDSFELVKPGNRTQGYCQDKAAGLKLMRKLENRRGDPWCWMSSIYVECKRDSFMEFRFCVFAKSAHLRGN